MKKIIISTIICVLTFSTLCGQTSKRTYKKFTDTTFKSGDIILGPVIYFELSSCQFIYAHKDSVMIIANFIKKYPAFKIEIGVHTDSRGNPKSNILLSECRANSIRDFLTKEIGLTTDNIVAKGYGSSQLRVSDEEIKQAKCKDCEDRHPKNRRVEIKILGT